MNRPIPKQQAPKLEVQTLENTTFDLANNHSDTFTLLVFYRGLHCPLCKKYLQQLRDLLPEFDKLGVQVMAVSMDTEKRARFSQEHWELDGLAMGYGLEENQAKDWGLYRSRAVKEGEPLIFSEPGLFLIDGENKIYYAAINSNPWGRPYLASFVKAVDYVISADYPARGEVV